MSQMFAQQQEEVAPYVGAWIETEMCSNRLRVQRWSHPTWVRGLKLTYTLNAQSLGVVAPYVGAWIETWQHSRPVYRKNVAPYVGAWIETFLCFNVAHTARGRTLRGCVD